jgi:PAS domain S-box-containing protein
MKGRTLSRRRIPSIPSGDEYPLLMRNVKDYAIVLFDDKGRITDWNTGAETIFGYGREEILGKPSAILFTPEDAAKDAPGREMKRAKQDRRAVDERWHMRKDGSRFWASGMIYPLLDEEGGLRGFVKILRDFSEGRHAADTLFESEKKLEFVLENMKGHALFMMDTEGRIATWNKGATRLLGYETQEILGRHFSVLFTEEDVDARAPLAELAKAKEEGKAEDERWHKRKDGSLFWASGAVTPLSDHEGTFRGYIKVLRDASERKRDEDAQKMQSIGRLAGGVAHDFNNLLTTISGYSELLLASRSLDDSTRSGLEEIREAGNRAAALTRQLLAFGGRQILEPLVLDLNELIGNLEKLIRGTLGEGIQLNIETDPNLENILMDPSQMEQILLNLALNARDAMKDGGQVLIRTSNQDLSDREQAAFHSLKPGRYVRLTFSDTGKGMDAQTRAKAFEPFFTTKRMGAKPSGLGLASVYGILRQSGGTIMLDSRYGEGAEFSVYLPAAVAVPSWTAHGMDADKRPHAARGTILIVEDEDSVRKLAARVTEANGYTVLEARDGEEALAVLKNAAGSVQLILSDLIMPRLGGFEMAKRARILYPQVRLAFMSGYTENPAMHKETEAAQAVFIQKPFTPMGLLEKLEEAIAGDLKRT